MIILTTKAQDAVKSVSKLKPLLRNDSVLLVLQNGLAIKELIQEVIGDAVEVVRGLVLMAAEFLKPGKITFWQGSTIIERTKTGKRIQALFKENGLETRLTPEIKKEEWNKLIFNCVINPLSAVLRVKDNEIEAPAIKEIRHRIVEECSLVAKAEGIHLGHSLGNEIDRKIKGYTNYSSMYQDVVKGKKTEIGFLNGKIVELGRRHGIKTPVNETIGGFNQILGGKEMRLEEFRNRKGKEKIIMLTAYDYQIAKILDEGAIDIILVGDSLGMVVQGCANTRGVTMDDMLYHTRAVARGVKKDAHNR